MSYAVVAELERELCRYTGAPFAIATNSCSMALLIALAYFPPTTVIVPRHTYGSVPQSAHHAGHKVRFEHIAWIGEYPLSPLPVWDSARRFTAGMFRLDNIQCVSFQTSKILGIEQGGAILLDNPQIATWLRRARFDGRLDASEKVPQQLGWHCYMNPSTAALALQRLSCLPRDNPDQSSWSDFPDVSQSLWNA